MAYKIIYHAGKEIAIKTRALSGTADLDDDSLVVKNDSDIVVPFKDMESVSMFRLHGTCRMLRIIHSGGTLFLTVVRFDLWGYFAVVIFFKTGERLRRLESVVGRRGAES